MNFLIDTHFLLWIFINPEKIDKKILSVILDENNLIFYSQVSLWEISIKYSNGKLHLKGIDPSDFYDAVHISFFKCKLIENMDLATFHNLPLEHKDPFDRLLIWQAIKSGYTVISADDEFKKYKKHGLVLL